MKKPGKPRRSLDPMERAIDDALELGRYIPYAESWGFAAGLEAVAIRIDRLRALRNRHGQRLYTRTCLRA